MFTFVFLTEIAFLNSLAKFEEIRIRRIRRNSNHSVNNQAFHLNSDFNLHRETGSEK